MRRIVLVGWLVLPVGAWAYHEGPGQDRVALEATEAVLASAHQAASEGDWKLAIREYEAALESLPKDPEAFDVRVAQRLQIELNKARMQSEGLIEARDELATLVEQMQAVDTDDVLPMAHPLEMSQRLRVDEVTETNQRELYQSNAPQAEAGLFLVPKVIE